MASLGDVVNNIRYTWQQMKNDTSMQDAVRTYYTTTWYFLWLPLILSVFIVYHNIAGIFPYAANASLIVLIVILLFVTSAYFWMNQTFRT